MTHTWPTDTEPNLVYKKIQDKHVKILRTDRSVGEYIRQNVKMITRKTSYKTPSHPHIAADSIFYQMEHNKFPTDQTEKHMARGVLFERFPAIGKIIDFEVPLKNTKADKGAGKIDMLALSTHDQSAGTLTLLELKEPKNTESIWRALLEIQTYWQQVNREKLLADFGLSDLIKPEPAILIFKGGKAHKEYDQAAAEYAKNYGIKIYLYESDSAGRIYSIEKLT